MAKGDGDGKLFSQTHQSAQYNGHTGELPQRSEDQKWYSPESGYDFQCGAMEDQGGTGSAAGRRPSAHGCGASPCVPITRFAF